MSWSNGNVYFHIFHNITQTNQVNGPFIHQNNSPQNYYGLAEGKFKYRYNNHTMSFNLQSSEKPYVVKSAIAGWASLFKCGTRRCHCALLKITLFLQLIPSYYSTSIQKFYLNAVMAMNSSCKFPYVVFMYAGFLSQVCALLHIAVFACH